MVHLFSIGYPLDSGGDNLRGKSDGTNPRALQQT